MRYSSHHFSGSEELSLLIPLLSVESSSQVSAESLQTNSPIVANSRHRTVTVIQVTKTSLTLCPWLRAPTPARAKQE